MVSSIGHSFSVSCSTLLSNVHFAGGASCLSLLPLAAGVTVCHVVYLCPSQHPEGCLRRTPFEAIYCSTYGFCTLIPGSFYTSSPFQGSSAYPQTWKPLHTSKSIVLYTVQVLPSLQILYKMWQEVLGVIFEHGESSRGKKLVLIYLCSLYQVRSCAERGKEGTGNCLG